MHLVGEVLDKQVVDARGCNAGRVDGIVLALGDDGRVRVTHLEIGPVTLLRRFSRGLARRYAALDARLGEGRGEGYRVSVDHVRFNETSVHIDFDASDT